MGDKTNPETTIPIWPWLLPMLGLLLAVPTTYSNTELYHGCQLSNYTDPTAHGCLKRVTCLWVGGDAFKNVTRKIAQSQVSELNITKCRRGVPTPIVLNQQSLDPVIGLSSLHIEDCKVSPIEKNAFKRMTSLRVLRLIAAEINELESTVFSSLLNLEQLDLSSNPIHYISLELTPKLKSLTLRDCLLADFSIWASIQGGGGKLQLSKLDLHTSRDSSHYHDNISVVSGLTNLINNASELILDGNNLDFTKTFSFAGSKVSNISMLSITVWNETDLNKLGQALKGKLVERLVVSKTKTKKIRNVTYDAFEDVDLKVLVVEANFHRTDRSSPNPFRKLANLTELHLRNCDYKAKYVPGNFTDIVKNLKSLSLNHASLDNLHVKGLSSLRTLDLSNNIARGSNYKLNITENHDLRSLNLSCVNASIQLRIEPCGGFRELILRNITISNSRVGVNLTVWQTHIPCLRHVDLSSNNQDYYPNFPFFTWMSNVRDVFLGLENIEELDVNDTDIGDVDREDLKYVFLPLKRLKRLNLADSLFKHDYPEEIFQNQVELKELDWSSNDITAIGNVVFSTLRKLRHLDLRNNQLIYISGDALRALTNLQTFLMWENSFACDCNLRHFTNWLVSVSMFVIPKEVRCESYAEPCRSPPKYVGHRLESFQPSWLDCDNNRSIVTLSTLFSLLFCISASMSFYAYRKRLSIRYWYVIRKLKHKRQRLPPGYIPLTRLHSFDVFVVYKHDKPQERRWVEQTFLPEIEDSNDVAFRVATVEREFQASGRPEVIDMVEGGFRQSSHVIFIVTNEFLSWEKSDYMMTQAEVLYHEKGTPEPILVLKEGITSMDQAPLSYKRLIRHVVRLHWPQGQGCTEDFWKNLRLVLLGELYPSRTKAIYAGY